MIVEIYRGSHQERSLFWNLNHLVKAKYIYTCSHCGNTWESETRDTNPHCKNPNCREIKPEQNPIFKKCNDCCERCDYCARIDLFA